MYLGQGSQANCVACSAPARVGPSQRAERPGPVGALQSGSSVLMTIETRYSVSGWRFMRKGFGFGREVLQHSPRIGT